MPQLTEVALRPVSVSSTAFAPLSRSTGDGRQTMKSFSALNDELSALFEVQDTSPRTFCLEKVVPESRFLSRPLF